MPPLLGFPARSENSFIITARPRFPARGAAFFVIFPREVRFLAFALLLNFFLHRLMAAAQGRTTDSARP